MGGAMKNPFNTIANVATFGAYDALDISGDKARNAAVDAQKQGMGSANQALANTYGQQQNYLNPYNDAGKDALAQLSGGNIMDGYKESDAYKFNLQQGQTAINNNLASRGLGNSGAAQKALLEHQTGLLSQDQQQYYNNQMGRLDTLAGYGNSAANNLASAAGAYGSNLSNNYMGLGNATAAANIAQANNKNALIGQGIGAGAMLLASDENLKKNFSEVPKEELAELKKGLKAFYFEYKDELYGSPGRWIGIKAQDLEKTKIGKEIVVHGESGEKLIDMRKVHSIFLATMAESEAA